MSAARFTRIHLAGLRLQLLHWSLQEASSSVGTNQHSPAKPHGVSGLWLKAWNSLSRLRYTLLSMCYSKVGKKTWKSILKAKIHNCEHSQQWDGLGWKPGIFYECFQSPKAVIPSLLAVLNSLAQSTRLLLCAHSFTQCSWAYLSKTITQSLLEIVALNVLFHQSHNVTFPRLKAQAGTATPCTFKWCCG